MKGMDPILRRELIELGIVWIRYLMPFQSATGFILARDSTHIIVHEIYAMKGHHMRLSYSSTLLAAVALVAPALAHAQAAATETSRVVQGGGITAAGWTGKIDANEERQGQKLENAKFAQSGGTFNVTTGPAVTYWNPANKATGNYTVKATFTEPKYMNLNDHPHPYGIMIGGNDLGGAEQSYVYCAAYGNGNFIVRGFGPAAFQLNGRRGEANDAVHKAAAKGEPVTQEIAMSVKDGRVECSINGKVVAGYDKAAAVGEGKLKSTDGVYGLRFAHNTEVNVTGFSMTRN